MKNVDKDSVVDLRTCKPGQKLLTKHGTILTYVGNFGVPSWPHIVEFSDGGRGSRTDDGFVYKHPTARLDSDEDIVQIID